MKLSTNFIKEKGTSLLESPTERVNSYEETSEYRVGGNHKSEDCMRLVKVFVYILVVLMVSVIGWTGLAYSTPKLSSSIRRTDTPLADSEFRRLLYGLDRRIRNDDTDGVPAEDAPWPSVSGDTVTTATKSAKEDNEMDEVIMEKLLRLRSEETKGLQATDNNQHSGEVDTAIGRDGSKLSDHKISSDSDSQRRATPMQSLKLSDLIRNSDYLQNSNMKVSSGESFSHSRSDYESASSILQSHDRSSDKGTEQPAPRIKRSARSRFEEIDPEREKCKGSLDPAQGMMDKLAIDFVASDASDPRTVRFRRKFRDNMRRLFWNVILQSPDRRRTVLKKNDSQVQGLLSAMRILSTDAAQQNVVKSSPPTREMTHQFRVIIETVVVSYVKCMRTLELARRATPGGQFGDYK